MLFLLEELASEIVGNDVQMDVTEEDRRRFTDCNNSQEEVTYSIDGTAWKPI